MSHQTKSERVLHELYQRRKRTFQFRVILTRPGNDDEVFSLRQADPKRPQHYVERGGRWDPTPLPADNTPSRWRLESNSRDFQLTILNGGNIIDPHGKPFRPRNPDKPSAGDRGVTIADLTEAGSGMTIH